MPKIYQATQTITAQIATWFVAENDKDAAAKLKTMTENHCLDLPDSPRWGEMIDLPRGVGPIHVKTINQWKARPTPRTPPACYLTPDMAIPEELDRLAEQPDELLEADLAELEAYWPAGHTRSQAQALLRRMISLIIERNR